MSSSSNPGAAWEPLRRLAPTLPDFPTHVLTPDIERFVLDVAAATQTSPALVGPYALAVISAAMRGRVSLKAWEGWTTHCNLYVMCLAEPGEGKSPMVRALTSSLASLQDELRRSDHERFTAAQAAREAAEAAVAGARKAVKEDPASTEAQRVLQNALVELSRRPTPALVRLFVGGDATPEALHSVVAEQGGILAVLTDEGAQLIENTTRYTAGAPNLGVLLAGSDGAPSDVLRVGRHTPPIDAVILTLGLAIQPVALQGKTTERARGLLGRFLIAAPDSLVGRRDMSSANRPVPAIRGPWLDLLRRLVYAPTVELRLGRDAEAEFQRFRQQNEDQLADGGRLAFFRDWGAKLPGQWLKLAGVAHSLYPEVGKTVSAEAAEAATALCTFFAAHSCRTFAQTDATPTIGLARRIERVVLRWAEDQPSEERPLYISQRELQRRLGRTTAELHEAIDLVVSLDLLRPHTHESGPKGGQPGKGFLINPALLQPRPERPSEI